MAYDWYPCSLLIGDVAGSLDNIDGSFLLDGNRAVVNTGDFIYHYIFDDDSAAAANSPLVIPPASNPGDGRWLLVNVFLGAVTGDITTTEAIGRDTDNEIAWTSDDQLDITIGGSTSAIVSISTGAGDNDKLVTQGYVDDSVAAVDTWDEVIHNGNSTTIADTENFAITINQNDVTNNPSALTITNTGSGNDITAPSFSLKAGALTATGLALGANSITMTGSLAVTGSRVTKGWFTDIESTNIPTVGGTSINTGGTLSNVAYLDQNNIFTSSNGISMSNSGSENPTFKLANSNADALSAKFRFQKNSASPADDDKLGKIYFDGNDSGASNTTFAILEAFSSDVTDGDEAGEITITVLMDGTERNMLNINGYNGSVNQGEIVLNEEGQDVDFRVEASGVANAFFVQGSDGKVGIGAASPLYDVDLSRSAAFTQHGISTFSSNIAHYPILNFKKSKSNTIGTHVETAADEFLGVINFIGVNSSSATVNGCNIFARQTAAAGANYIPTAMIFQTSSGSAAASEAFRVTGVKNLKLGGSSAVRGTTEGTNHLDIFDGTAPVGTLTNGISLYSTAGELRVMDSGGTATLLSSHSKETGDWIHDSYNVISKKRLLVRIEELCKFIDAKFGTDFVKEIFDEAL